MKQHPTRNSRSAKNRVGYTNHVKVGLQSRRRARHPNERDHGASQICIKCDIMDFGHDVMADYVSVAAASEE